MRVLDGGATNLEAGEIAAVTQPLSPQSGQHGSAARTAARFVLPLAPSLVRRRLQVYLALIVGDALGITAAFATVCQLLGRPHELAALGNILVLFIPIYWTMAINRRVYSVRALMGVRFALIRVAHALIATVVVMIALFYFAHSPLQFGRLSLELGLLAAAVVLLGMRSLIRPLVVRRCGVTAENVLIINDGGALVRVPGAWSIRARDHNLKPDCTDPHMLDRLGLFMTNMDRVLVTCPPERRAAWAMVFKGSNISGEIVDSDVLALGVIGARRTADYGTLVVSLGPLSLKNRAIKRAMDLTVAGGALLALCPLLLVIAALIRLEDGGPVFFRQQRQGRNNRLFWITKFRSMRVQQSDLAGERSTARADDRFTAIGRFIRRTSIDELPQLFNVLSGDMSIVGPRPHAIGSLAGNKRFWDVDPRYLLRHALKPGLTGLAQVRGLRGATDRESDLVDRLQADLEYLDGWTVLRDIRIMVATLGVVVHDRAY